MLLQERFKINVVLFTRKTKEENKLCCYKWRRERLMQQYQRKLNKQNINWANPKCNLIKSHCFDGCWTLLVACGVQDAANLRMDKCAFYSGSPIEKEILLCASIFITVFGKLKSFFKRLLVVLLRQLITIFMQLYSDRDFNARQMVH